MDHFLAETVTFLLTDIEQSVRIVPDLGDWCPARRASSRARTGNAFER
jgi:hypothetical protein